MGLEHMKSKEMEKGFSPTVEINEAPVQMQFSIESITDMSELTGLRQRTKNGHMDDIKESISFIEGLMHSPEGFAVLPVAYNDAIDMCRSYLNSKNPFFSDGQHRKDVVRNSLAKLLRAKEVFETAMTNFPFFAEDAASGADVTPAKMLKEASTLLTHDQKSEIELKSRKQILTDLKRPKGKEDSLEMTAVKTSYGQMIDMLMQKVDLNDMDTVADRTSDLMACMEDVITKCNEYLDKGTPHTHEGKVRRAVVEKILKEVSAIEGRIPQMLLERKDSPELSEINTMAGIYCAAFKKYTVIDSSAVDVTSGVTSDVTTDLTSEKKDEVVTEKKIETEPKPTVVEKPKVEEVAEKPKEKSKPAPKTVEIVAHQRVIDGKTVDYNLEKIVPTNLADALEYRQRILNQIEEDRLDGKARELFDYYSQFVVTFRQQEGHKIDPSKLRRIKTTNLDLAARRRNRILEGGLVKSDLTADELEVYNYYDQIVQQLKQIDLQASEVKPHDMLEIPQYDLQLDATLQRLYESQDVASNDCWSCAGSAVLNHFMKRKALSAKQFRATDPVFLDMEDMEGIDDESSYLDAIKDVTDITVNNQSWFRVGCPMGNPFLLADRYFDELRKDPAYKNVMVKNAVFYRGDALTRARGEHGMPPQDPSAFHNLKVKFMNTVAGAIQKDSAIAMLIGKHYYTIVGIRGNNLLVHNSQNHLHPGNVEELDMDKVIFSGGTSGLELTWLERMDDPEAVAREYSELKYDKTTGKFTEGSVRNRDDIAHVQGMVGRKGLLEQDEEVRALVSETVYVPKEYQP